MDGMNYELMAKDLKETLIHNPIAGLAMEGPNELAKQIETLGELASKPEASDEVKKKLAATSIQLHNTLSSMLSELRNSDPGKFNNNVNVANVVAAYNINANIFVKALEEVHGDVLPVMIQNSFENVVKIASDASANFNKDEMERQLAKTLYYATLKAEYDRVHGSEAEQKEWRAQILSELVSDQFDEKLKEFQKSPLYLKAAEKFRNAPWQGLEQKDAKKLIDEAVSEIAEDEYHKAYNKFGFGVFTDYDKELVLTPVSKIEELHIIADSVGTEITDREGLKNFDEDPHFDTMDIKKRAGLYGRFEDSVGKLLYQEQYKEKMAGRLEETNKKIEEEVNKKYSKEKKPFTFDKTWEPMLKVIAECNAVLDDLYRKKEQEENKRKFSEKKQEITKNYDLEISYQRTKRDQTIGVMKQLYDPYKVSDAIKEYEESYTSDRLRNDEIRDEKQRAKKLVEDLTESHFKDIKNENEYIASQAMEYTRVTEFSFSKNPEKAKEIREKRVQQDVAYKERNVNFYDKRNVDGKVQYVRRTYDETKNKMIENYRILKEQYKVTNAKTDREFENDLRKNDRLEQEYQKPILLQKPDRSNVKMAVFDPTVRIESKEIDFSKIPVSNGIAYPDYHPQIQDYKTEGAEPDEALDNAISFASEYEKVYRGTQEYADILADMRAAKTAMEKSEDAENTIRRLVSTIAKMDQYIDRKNDEKDRGKESKTAYHRRCAMESARNMLYQAVNTLKDRNEMADHDFEFTKAAAAIENAMKLKDVRTVSAQDLVNTLKHTPNSIDGYKRALGEMRNYLFERTDDYLKVRKNGKTAEKSYGFRVDENDPAGRRRLPNNGEERVYKTVLKSFMDLEKSYLNYVKNNVPERLTEARFDVTYYQPETNRLSEIDDKLHIDLKKGTYEPDTDPVTAFRETKNPESYKEQFVRIYKIYANEMKYNNLEGALNQGSFYDPNGAISYDGRQKMVDAALSSLYLDEYAKTIKDSPDKFSFVEMEKGRQQFVSVVRNSSQLYMNLSGELVKHFDLRKNGADLHNLKELANQKEGKAATPDQFRKTIVPKAMAETLSPFINECQMYLLPDGKFNKNTVSNLLEKIDYHLKIAKALKISDEVDKAVNDKFMQSEFKGATFAETLKNMKDAVQQKMVHKQVEAPKGIKL